MKLVCVENPQKKYLKNDMQDRKKTNELIIGEWDFSINRRKALSIIELQHFLKVTRDINNNSRMNLPSNHLPASEVNPMPLLLQPPEINSCSRVLSVYLSSVTYFKIVYTKTKTIYSLHKRGC